MFWEKVNNLVWGIPTLILILGVGLYLSVQTGWVQIRFLPRAIRKFWRMLTATSGDSTPFQSLCNALAATVGTGNLVGVAGALCLGGPGAIFWMWVGGFLGMATKFAEATLAIRYRKKVHGGYACGPMYMITMGMGERFLPLALCYSLFGIIASFGVGNATQINAVVSGINSILSNFGIQPGFLGNLLQGLLLAVIIGMLLLGGAKRIGNVTQTLIPVVSAAYIMLGILALILRYQAIPQAFVSIIQGAFHPAAVTGGMVGSAFQALRVGSSRGVFTNEAGMGTASMAHGSANVDHPAEQGLMGIMEVFLDTIVICTLTALVILTSGISIPYGKEASALTGLSFSKVCGGWSEYVVTGALILFAVATVLGWGIYGNQCVTFLMGEKYWKPFALVQIAMVIFSAVADTASVWSAAQAINGLMAIPNLIALAALSKEVVRLVKEYKEAG